MNTELLDEVLRSSTELEVVRLMTCNFDESTFSLVSEQLPPDITKMLRSSIKYRTHLAMQPTTLQDLKDKMVNLSYASTQSFSGSASKDCVYSGILLRDSKTLFGTVEEPVSYNEYEYLFKPYPWWVKPINPTFTSTVDMNAENGCFICLSTFDLKSLESKADVSKVTEKFITLNNKTRIPIIIVD